MQLNQISRLFDIPQYQLETFGNPVAFNTKRENKWIPIRSDEYIEKAEQLSRALLKIGIQPEDKIGIIATLNCTDWNIIDIGIQMIGAISVPIYPNITPREYEYIFNHAEVKLCFLSDIELLSKVSKIKANCKTLQEVYSFEPLDGCACYKDLIASGASLPNQPEVDAIKNAILPDDLVTIIYTSGTTGVPKGVMLTHRNIVENVISALDAVPKFHPGAHTMSYLPVCHILERAAVYVYQILGLKVFYGEGLDMIGDNIRETKPFFMTVVPRLLEKIYDKIYSRGTELTGVKKWLFYWAVDLGLHYDVLGKNSLWYRFKLAIARKLIFSKWQKALGGNLKYLICGSAALQPRLIRIFGAAGIQIIEGYGLSESPILTLNNIRLGKVRPGTVGVPLDMIEIKIADDGEILAKGNNVMLGYYKDEERTESVLRNGYFHTGDKGEFDADGFLKITGRKKEIFKTSGGKYISPVLLETQLKQSRFIEQVMVIGENEKMPAAIIQPDFEFLKAWIERKEHKIELTPLAMVSHKKVIKRIAKEVKKSNKKFGQWEKIKRFELTSEIWGIDNGLLTPTLKMKRDAIHSKFQDLYDKIFAET
jgi:long-chain acyl-CoA synthetase